MRHALTVDVEDYFHVSAFADTLDRTQWDSIAPRVEDNTRRLLDLFASRNTHATFFVLGWVAERFPQLVRDIASQGHEVASHGFSHQLVYSQKPEVFREETAKSKAILEDLTGLAVDGYRAASYSITGESLWALDILSELGFKYDSSIFPVYHDRYGMPSAPPTIHNAVSPSGGELVEYPLTVARLFKWSLPVAGGGYFRLYPYWLSRALLAKSQRDLDQPFIFYLHPWEIDPGQPRVENASHLSRFRHYQNLGRCHQRLEKLLTDFDFTTVANVLSEHKQKGGLPVYDYGSQSLKSG